MGVGLALDHYGHVLTSATYTDVNPQKRMLPEWDFCMIYRQLDISPGRSSPVTDAPAQIWTSSANNPPPTRQSGVN